ncbi:phosphotransferase [Streptomyces sp. NPDC005180]|uniref:phosphotransferase n=1 Tax=Streptomyces sp. NPDC005180 TaxID=3156868 RepID=UPI0033BED8A2
MIEDGATDQGSVTTVRRVGETIRRPTGAWTPAVHALLDHLEAAGFTRAPRALGTVGGEEVVSLLHGEPAFSPWPAALRTTRGIRQLAAWLRQYHEAVRDFRPPADARWRGQEEEWRPGLIIRHGDLGPWNSIWNGDRLTGFIDWDFAAPGTPSTTSPNSPGTPYRSAPTSSSAGNRSPATTPSAAASTPSAPPTGHARQPSSTRWRPSSPARRRASNGSADRARSRGRRSSPAVTPPR